MSLNYFLLLFAYYKRMQKLVSSGKPTDLSAQRISPVSNFHTAVPGENVKEVVSVAVHWCLAAASDPGSRCYRQVNLA